MEYNTTLPNPSPHPNPNDFKRFRHLSHATAPPPPTAPPSRSRPISYQQSIKHAPTLSTNPPISFPPEQPTTMSLTAPQSTHHLQHPFSLVPPQRPTISRPIPHQKQQPQSLQRPPTQDTSSSSVPLAPKPHLPLPAPQSRPPPPPANSTPAEVFPPTTTTTAPGRVLHTLLPPEKHIVRANTPIRPFILSLPVGTPFHKRYKALLLLTRTHGTVVQSTFLAGPYFSYRDPVNNQVHFLINDILVPEGRWADELSYKVQVLESGLGVLDKDRKTWGNHWREMKEEREGVVVFEGKSERNVMLFWYGDGDDGEGAQGLVDDLGEEGRRLLEEGVWQWVN